MVKALKRHQSRSYDIQMLQDNLTEYSNGLLASVPIINGNYIEDIVITSGTEKIVNHLLNRKPLGFFVGRKSANAVIWDTQASNTNPTTTLALNASANVTISIWVF